MPVTVLAWSVVDFPSFTLYSINIPEPAENSSHLTTCKVLYVWRERALSLVHRGYGLLVFPETLRMRVGWCARAKCAAG